MTFLSFDVKRNSVNLLDDFLKSNGALNAAAADDGVHIALTPVCERGAVSQLITDETKNVMLKLPDKGDGGQPGLPTDAHVVTCLTRVCTGITGTVVDAIAGDHSIPLSEFIDACKDNSTVCLQPAYGAYKEPSTTVTCNNIKFVDGDGNKVDPPSVVADEAYDIQTQNAEDALVNYWQQSCDLRGSVLEYTAMPGLTKPIVAVPTGFRSLCETKPGCSPSKIGTGYEPTFGTLSSRTPYSPDELETLLEHAVKAELAFDPEKVEQFLEECKEPNETAMKHVDVAAAAIAKTGGVWTTNYKADGVTTSTGSGGIGVITSEHWPVGAKVKTHFNGDDCDGSAVAICQTARQIGIGPMDDDGADSVSETRPFARAIKNAAFHHVVGLSVLGACCGSGDELKDIVRDNQEADVDNVKPSAGHACALMIPAADFLKACAHSDGFDYEAMRLRVKTSAGPQVPVPGQFRKFSSTPEHAAATNQIRTSSVFPAHRVRQLGDSCSFLTNGVVDPVKYAASYANGAYTIAMEGTCVAPTTPMWQPDRQVAAKTRKHEAKRQQALSKVGATIGHTMMNLPAILPKAHSFYAQFVEVAIPRIFENEEAQKHGCASGHFVFHSVPSSKDAIVQVGSSPKQVTMGEYALAPMARLSEKEAKALQWGIETSATHHLPPTGVAVSATEAEIKNIASSTDVLQDLHDTFQQKRNSAEANRHHQVVGAGCDAQASNAIDNESSVQLDYHVVPAVMARNPLAVLHLKEQLEKCASDVVVDFCKLDSKGHSVVAVVSAIVKT
tara:strand:+ start:3296 stop:5647 length:2352 start_codon:yes stop_codon:yes gene_type:complete